MTLGGWVLKASRGLKIDRTLALCTAILLASCDNIHIGPIEEAPDIALTPQQVRAVRLKGGWGPLPPSAHDVRLFVYDPGKDSETQLLRFRLKTSEADALASRLLAGGRPVGRGNCLWALSDYMAWWPKGCPEGAEEGERDNLDRGFARVILRNESEMSTMWLGLGAGWH